MAKTTTTKVMAINATTVMSMKAERMHQDGEYRKYCLTGNVLLNGEFHEQLTLKVRFL